VRWLSLGLVGCVSPIIVVPLESDLANAPAGATLDQLAAGRALYVRSCSGCHHLHVPSERSPTEWDLVLDEMSRKAKLPAEDADLIRLYLETVAAR
jgi:hypothetical protein